MNEETVSKSDKQVNAKELLQEKAAGELSRHQAEHSPARPDAEYIGQDVVDPTLVGHWALDETEGMLATDSVGNNDGLVLGNPLWQPEGGHIKGALQYDGIDDMMLVRPVLNSSDKPFSIFAWIKGGQPGQHLLVRSD